MMSEDRLVDWLEVHHQHFADQEIDCAAKFFISCNFTDCKFVNVHSTAFSDCGFIRCWPLDDVLRIGAREV